MRARLLATLTALLILAGSEAAAQAPVTPAPDPTPRTCDWRTVHQHASAAKADIRRAFQPDASKQRRQAKAWQPHKFCLLRQHDRHRIAAYVDRKRAAAQRRAKAGRSWCAPESLLHPEGAGCWVIPAWCVHAESGGSWSSHNPTSPARGPYQLLSHGEPWPVDTRGKAMRHHEIAAGLFAAGGLGPWEACS